MRDAQPKLIDQPLRLPLTLGGVGSWAAQGKRDMCGDKVEVLAVVAKSEAESWLAHFGKAE